MKNSARGRNSTIIFYFSFILPHRKVVFLGEAVPRAAVNSACHIKAANPLKFTDGGSCGGAKAAVWGYVAVKIVKNAKRVEHYLNQQNKIAPISLTDGKINVIGERG